MLRNNSFHCLGVLVLTTTFTGCGESGSVEWQTARSHRDQRDRSGPAAIAATGHIFIPRNGDIITTAEYDEMSGTVELADSGTVFVFARDKFNYFLQYPPSEVDGGSFSQSNIRLSTPGKWELHLCVATPAAAAGLHAAARRGEWAFPVLPGGVTSIAKSVIYRGE